MIVRKMGRVSNVGSGRNYFQSVLAALVQAHSDVASCLTPHSLAMNRSAGLRHGALLRWDWKRAVPEAGAPPVLPGQGFAARNSSLRRILSPLREERDRFACQSRHLAGVRRQDSWAFTTRGLF